MKTPLWSNSQSSSSHPKHRSVTPHHPTSRYSWRVVASSITKGLKVKHLSNCCLSSGECDSQDTWFIAPVVADTAYPGLTEQRHSGAIPPQNHDIGSHVELVGFSSNTFQNCSSVLPSEPCWAVPTTIPAQLLQSPEQALQKLVLLQKPSCHQHHPSHTTTATFFNFHQTSRVLPAKNCELWAFKCGNQ